MAVSLSVQGAAKAAMEGGMSQCHLEKLVGNVIRGVYEEDDVGGRSQHHHLCRQYRRQYLLCRQYLYSLSQRFMVLRKGDGGVVRKRGTRSLEDIVEAQKDSRTGSFDLAIDE